MSRDAKKRDNAPICILVVEDVAGASFYEYKGMNMHACMYACMQT